MNTPAEVRSPFTVLVVEDAQPIRGRLAQLVGSMPGVGAVLQARDCAGALRKIRERRPDAVLLDVFLPDGTGFDVLGALPACAKRPRVIVLSSAGDGALRQPLLDAGAEQVFDKANGFIKALEAIEAMAGGSLAPG